MVDSWVQRQERRRETFGQQPSAHPRGFSTTNAKPQPGVGQSLYKKPGLTSNEGYTGEPCPSESLLPTKTPVSHLPPEGPHALLTFIDSEADASIIDEELAGQFVIGPRSCLVPASALDAHLLGTVSHQTTPVYIQQPS